MRAIIKIGIVCSLLLTAACSEKQPWQTNDISGAMPPLKFDLTNEDHKAVSAEDYRDKANLLYFGFTNCATACPTTLSRLARLINKLAPQQRKHIEVLFVSVDPRRDTPAILKKYTDNFGPEFIGLSGTQEQLQALSKRYHATYGYGKADAKGNYMVSHSAAVYGFAPDGNIEVLMSSSNSDAAVLADLRRLAQAS